MLVGAYGQGSNPNIMKVPGTGTACFYTPPSAQDITFQDLSFDSVWGLDSVYGANKVPADGLALGGQNITVIGCSFYNVSDAVDTEARPTGVLIQDNYMGPSFAPTASGPRAWTTSTSATP